MRLKILSWNIWFYGNLPKVNEFLENFGADILGLQEVMRFDDKLQISKILTEKLGYKFVYAPAFQYPIKGRLTEVGNAIFSKYPIISHKVHNLSDEENRVAVQADIQIDDKILHAVSTHLLHTHQKPSKLQEMQAKNLTEVLPKEKTVLLGDFNALPDSGAVNIISDVLDNVDSKLLPTWSVYPEGCEICKPKEVLYKLDNIFTSKDIKSHSFKVESSKASDHLPISVLIEF